METNPKEILPVPMGRDAMEGDPPFLTVHGG
jgi:hypothetical protein